MSKKWIRPPSSMGDDGWRNWIGGGVIGGAVFIFCFALFMWFHTKGWLWL